MSKKFIKSAAAGLLLFLMVACGLEFTEMTFSSHAIKPGDTLTIKTKLERPNSEYDGNKNVWLYFAVRVPEDWTTAEMLTDTDICEFNGNILQTKHHEFENSEFYAALLELSYPKEGYKWLAYQTTEVVEEIYGQPVTTELVLKSGFTTGDFRLDFMGGSSISDPSDLYKDGSIDYDLAFNNWGDWEKLDHGNLKQPILGKYFVSCQEYLFNASTLTQSEIQSRETSLDYIEVKCPKDGNFYPVTPMDVVNKTPDFDLNVNVASTNTGVDEVYESTEIDVKAVKGGIEVTANGGVATVYDLAGRIIATQFVNGTATIATRPGACIVRVIEGNRSAVSKVIVR
ncbi:MAG: T9SS type A sorting domain-containing protein [Muribaculaceae bacterium]|nr:T9SS type A sorting domain-containing protein [Muribaculaceae bacterium]